MSRSQFLVKRIALFQVRWNALRGAGLLTLLVLAVTAEAVQAQCRDCGCRACRGACGQCCDPCRRGTMIAPSEDELGVQESAPGAAVDEAMAGPNALASSFGTPSAPGSSAPNMIGDFFGGGLRLPPIMGECFETVGANVPIGGGDRRFKIVESNSPIPKDRVFFNYHHFHNALLDVQNDTVSYDRFTFGLEKTFFNEMWSAELRIPFGAGLDATQDAIPGADLTATEFGNISLALKAILRQRRTTTLSAGLGIVLPTAGDAQAINYPGLDPQFQPFLFNMMFDNEAIHLQPFIGWLWEPNERWFMLAFAQCDFDLSGNDMRQRDTTTGNPITGFSDATLNDQNLLFLDLKLGYWLFRNRCSCWVTGMAPVVELHYTSTMQDTDSVMTPAGLLENPFNRMDVINITGGLHFELGPCSTFTVAGVAPLRGGEENIFDAEFSAQFERRF